MTKFVSQRDQFRCGPIAILNVLRWTGETAPYDTTVPSLTKLCKCDEFSGTLHRTFDKAIRKSTENTCNVTLIRQPSMTIIEQHISNGGIVVLNFRHPHSSGRHFTLITDMSDSGQSFQFVNLRKNEALTDISRRDFVYRLRKRPDRSYKAWFVTKVGTND